VKFSRTDERSVSEPEPGAFAVRLRKGAAEVAARIVHEPPRDPDTGEPLDRCPLWHAEINGEDDDTASSVPTEKVMFVWLRGRRISEGEFQFLLKDAEWCRTYSTDEPRANPRDAVDIRRIRAITP
jgi:hypothetical protein